MSPADRRARVDRDNPVLAIVAQCRLLKIARSTLYYRPAPVDLDDLAVMRRMDELYLASPFYGSRRMVAVLRREGLVINRKRVRRLMRVMGLEAIYQKPNTSRGHPDHTVYPYLLRGLIIDRPNQVWCADITYIPMARGFVYLVAVMDWFSRRVLSWRLSLTMEADFCVEAVQEAMAKHGRPEIFNTDQGVQFTSAGFLDELEIAGVRISMDGKGAFPGQHLHRAALAKPEIRRGFHQGVWLGDRGASGHRRMALFLQRGAAASGVGLPDAAYGFRRRSL
jgi:putative transposase